MLKTIFKISSLILTLFVIGFSVYLFIYKNSRKSLKLNKNQCSSICTETGKSCVLWNDDDQKCYSGYCKNVDQNNFQCIDRGDKNMLQNWQKSSLIISSIILVLCLFGYYST